MRLTRRQGDLIASLSTGWSLIQMAGFYFLRRGDERRRVSTATVHSLLRRDVIKYMEGVYVVCPPRGRQGPTWEKLVSDVKRAANGKCDECYRPIDQLEDMHVMLVGGVLSAVCPRCHNYNSSVNPL